MLVTWTALQLAEPSPTCPWLPEGARHAQAGHAAAGTATVPDFAGDWWTVLGVWDDEEQARRCAPPSGPGVEAWHLLLEPASFRGDAVLAGGATPFSDLPERGKVAGAAVVVTLAGLGADKQRTAEFFERFLVLGEDVRAAPGHRASLVQAPSDGAVLTFSAWETLRSAVTWAYHRPTHAETVHRQEEHGLLDAGGFLRCAVLSSSGTLCGTDPLAGLTGTVTRPPPLPSEQEQA